MDASIEFRPLTVLIGANGAGKSNLISFFSLVNALMAGRLQVHVRVNGGAESLLHFGSKQTSAFQKPNFDLNRMQANAATHSDLSRLLTGHWFSSRKD